jgi:pilus assembly protein Flp/PilA
MFDHVAASFATFVAAARHRLSREQTGATAVEYALMVGLIAVVLIGGLTVFGPQLSGFFKGLGAQLNITPAPAAPAVPAT